MKLWVLAKNLVLAAVLVAGLALAACESSGGDADGTGGGGGQQDTTGGGGGGTDTLVNMDSGGGGTTCDAANPCPTGFTCEDGACVPESTDNCPGGCPDGQVCQNGQCVEAAACPGGCAPGFECNEATGQCEAVDLCADKECGDDGAGGSCGTCDAGFVCDAGQCICQPDCALLECGPDPVCGESCGTCEAGVDCVNGQCPSPDCPGIAAQNCMGKQCGPDGCGGFCGQCAEGEQCNADQLCGCAPQCDGKVCGPDGCGGQCGTCGAGQICNVDGQCEAGETGGACIDWFDCANACPQGPDLQQCMLECDNTLSDQGLLAKNAFIACQNGNCGHCADTQCLTDCVFTSCRSEYAACYGSAGAGAGTCDDYFNCQNACPDFQTQPDAFEACDRQCMAQTSEAGLTGAYDLLFCLSANCDDSNWNQCVNAALSEGGVCFAEGESCFGEVSMEWCDPAVETCLSCGEMINCLNGCGGDQECANNCFLSTTEDTYNNEYQPIIDCLVANCPDGDLQNCDQQTLLSEGGACAAAWETCVGEGGGGGLPDPCTGDDCLDCAGMMTCLNGCGADQQCATDCLGQGTQEAQDQYIALGQCLIGECPDQDQTCMATAAQGACSAQYTACMGAAKSAPVIMPFRTKTAPVPAAKLKPIRRLQLSLQVLGR